MRSSDLFSPSIVPPGNDQVVYFVLDSFGDWIGQSWRETEVEDTDLETLLQHLLEGQHNDPVRSSLSIPPKAGRVTSLKMWPRCCATALRNRDAI
jgi:hypothetical protein